MANFTLFMKEYSDTDAALLLCAHAKDMNETVGKPEELSRAKFMKKESTYHGLEP